MGFHSQGVRFEGGGSQIVLGLKRTGKSCRLRWVNYLSPGLKRGKLTPQEEQLVLELQSKWGNRWSKIARKLPGRTDNEIKNYWRTYMRKTAQEKKRAKPPSPLSSSSSSSPSSTVSICSSLASSKGTPPTGKTKERSYYDTGGLDLQATKGETTADDQTELEIGKAYPMDEIWNAILSDENTINPLCCDGFSEEGCNFSSQTTAFSFWDYILDSPWMMDTDDSKITVPIPMEDQFLSCHEQERIDHLLTG